MKKLLLALMLGLAACAPAGYNKPVTVFIFGTDSRLYCESINAETRVAQGCSLGASDPGEYQLGPNDTYLEQDQ